MTSDFGLKLKELRISHDLSQQELAQKLNCHKNVISNYELGKRIPNGDALADIARVFGVSVDYLLGLEKPKMLPISGLNEKQQMILTTLCVELSKDDALEKQMKTQIKKLSQELTDAKKAASAAAAEQQALEMEIGRCLLGQSRFSEETLSKLITEKAAERKRLQNRAAELERSLKDQQGLTEGISTYYNRFQGWSAEFRLADRDRKRFIISQLYSRIELHRNYEIRFVLDANYQQFLEGRQSTAVQDFVERMARLSLHMNHNQMSSA